MDFAGIEFRRIGESSNEEIVEFLVNNLGPRETLTRCLKPPRETLEGFYAAYIRKGLQYNNHIGAYDSTTGEMVGCSINFFGKNGHCDDEEVAAFSEMQPLMEMLTHIAGRNPEETFGTSDYMELSILCTKAEYGKRGIGLEMVRRSENIAAEKGCSVIFIIPTSEFTLRAAKKLGYETRKEVSCKDYVSPSTGKKPFKAVQEPHTSAWLVAKTLTRSN